MHKTLTHSPNVTVSEHQWYLFFLFVLAFTGSNWKVHQTLLRLRSTPPLLSMKSISFWIWRLVYLAFFPFFFSLSYLAVNYINPKISFFFFFVWSLSLCPLWGKVLCSSTTQSQLKFCFYLFIVYVLWLFSKSFFQAHFKLSVSALLPFITSWSIVYGKSSILESSIFLNPSRSWHWCKHRFCVVGLSKMSTGITEGGVFTFWML